MFRTQEKLLFECSSVRFACHKTFKCLFLAASEYIFTSCTLARRLVLWVHAGISGCTEVMVCHRRLSSEGLFLDGVVNNSADKRRPSGPARWTSRKLWDVGASGDLDYSECGEAVVCLGSFLS